MANNRILANDGIADLGKQILEKAGYIVDTQTIPQNELADQLSNYIGVVVRSATKINAAIIEANPHLQFIGRGGVGLDNIDLVAAKAANIPVLNTPKASTRSVAEMVFALLLSGSRYIPDSAREIGKADVAMFKKLKNQFASGLELQHKTLGIIGFGNIGQETARIALGFNMRVIVFKRSKDQIQLDLPQFGIQVPIERVEMEELLKQSDIISIHTPAVNDGHLIGAAELAKMKAGCVLINTSRGGLIDESALLDALDSNHIGFACLDVFENEPNISEAIRQHPAILSTPHIGGSTVEAQDRVWIELAESILQVLKS